MSQAAKNIVQVPNPFAEKPSFTYFETKYKDETSQVRTSFEIPFDELSLRFGGTYECTIPPYGDILTGAFVRATLPPIYPTQTGAYVYPGNIAGTLYVKLPVTTVVADGTNLTANTSTSHFFSVGANVIISGTKYSIFDLDGTYTVSSIPTANSFVCSTTRVGVSYKGTVASPGIQPAPVVSYYSTQNINLWAQVPVNLPYTAVNGQITDPVASLVPDQGINIFDTSGSISGEHVVATSSGNTFTITDGNISGSVISFVEKAVTVTYDPLQNKFVFSSVVYPSITFTNAEDAAFWGFDYLQGPTFPFVNGQLTSQWTLTQGGWITGFLPPSTSAYADSVANKLVKEARVLVGRQVIKKYTGEYLELVNDLKIPYENKAILKLMNGTLDQTQAVASREYYVPLPLGCEEIPLCALTRQKVSFQIDFEEYQNLSNDLNKGSGDFFDPESYLTYNVSQNLLGGQTFNVASTLSYRQYILIFTADGTLLVYDTSKPVDESGSYQVISAFAGQTSAFVNSVILGTTLFIQLLDGHILGGNLDELIEGNTSSFEINDYLPMSPSDAGPPTGTMVCDAQYLYYAQSNLASNVFFVRYDTRTSLTGLGGYTAFNFTSNISSNTTSVYQILSTGSQLFALTNTPGTFYQFNLNGNFTTGWVTTDYSLYGSQITEGVVIGSTVYFVLDATSILVWSNENFIQAVDTGYHNFLFFITSLVGGSSDGIHWKYTSGNIPANFSEPAYGNGIWVSFNLSSFTFLKSYDAITWTPTQQISFTGYFSRSKAAYGNGIFVMSLDSNIATSTDGQTWSIHTAPFTYAYSVAYGNGIFVLISGSYGTATSMNGIDWTITSSFYGDNLSFANGLGIFITTDTYSGQTHVTTDGITWTTGFNIPAYSYGYPGAPAYGNGAFVVADTHGLLYSTDGNSWIRVRTAQQGGAGNYYVLFENTHPQTPVLPWEVLGTGFRNLHAVGTTIYASSSNACVISIDTTQDLTSQSAYKFYPPNAPISFAGNVPTIFANGPRYVYMFTNDLSETTSPTNAVRYDPYPPNKTLVASVIADYKVLPSNVPKPTNATIKYLQTQHVTGDNFADLQILGPVKELYVTGTANTTNVYQYSNLASSVSLTLTGGEQILTPDVGTPKALQIIAPYLTHTTMPVRNFSVIPFELNPESQAPNGTVNFSRMYYQQLSNGASVWATTYNILNISSGVGGLEFNSPY
jgi:hypothetical protein